MVRSDVDLRRVWLALAAMAVIVIAAAGAVMLLLMHWWMPARDAPTPRWAGPAPTLLSAPQDDLRRYRAGQAAASAAEPAR